MIREEVVVMEAAVERTMDDVDCDRPRSRVLPKVA